MVGKRWALLIACVACQATAGAATITFATDPFAGSSALTTPGRQVVGGELFTSFDPTTDVFAFDLDVFGVAPPLVIANDVIGGIPATGPNLIVLQTFDDDASAATPFGAGNAANLIAAQITTPGPASSSTSTAASIFRVSCSRRTSATARPTCASWRD
ncbi:MAG TPA: hypothetical protein VFX05_18510 [Casimicrobiaceae bacterium]|nr:hypothetical protein [Casimicrobiaceae bacterium]